MLDELEALEERTSLVELLSACVALEQVALFGAVEPCAFGKLAKSRQDSIGESVPRRGTEDVPGTFIGVAEKCPCSLEVWHIDRWRAVRERVDQGKAQKMRVSPREEASQDSGG